MIFLSSTSAFSSPVAKATNSKKSFVLKKNIYLIPKQNISA
ncbi:MAG: hypothetical protein ACI956_002673 [Nonlabens sp.]|jgi:hypothetical protein